MEAIVFIILQIFFVTCGIWKLGNIIWIFPSFSYDISSHVTRLNQLHVSKNNWWVIKADIRPTSNLYWSIFPANKILISPDKYRYQVSISMIILVFIWSVKYCLHLLFLFWTFRWWIINPFIKVKPNNTVQKYKLTSYIKTNIHHVFLRKWILTTLLTLLSETLVTVVAKKLLASSQCKLSLSLTQGYISLYFWVL